MPDTALKMNLAHQYLAEDLAVRIRHLENDFALTRSEYEDATYKNLALLEQLQQKNAELEALKESLETRVSERTVLLTAANLALEQEVIKQQRTEQALCEAEERTRLLVEHLPVYLLVIGVDCTARLVLNEYARRIVEAPLSARNYDAISFADLAGNLIATETIIREASSHGTFDRECKLCAGIGQTVPVRLVVVPRHDKSGKVSAFYGFAENIIEKYRAEEAARRHTDEMARAGKLIALGTLVAGVAHEMNNPNNLIMLGVPVLKKWFQQLFDMVLDRELNEEELASLMQMRNDIPRLMNSIEEGARRMRDIVKNLRDFARPDDQDNNHLFDVNQQLVAAKNLLDGAVRAAVRRFDVIYGDNLPMIRGNPGQIRQIAANLIKNAYESIQGPDGWICVRTCFDASQSEVVLEVEDNGTGIPPENKPHICDPFFTTRRDKGAMGLGLAIAAGVVRTHGGSLAFDSNSVCGTKVTVRLPASNKDAAALTPRASS